MIIDHALRYAAAGWPVFLLSRTKAPVANCPACPSGAHHGADCDHLVCHGHLAATRDPERLRKMLRLVPGGMLGLRTGAVSGLVVVDVDPRNGGTQSLAQLMGLGLLPRTAWVRTGSDGVHLYYRHPGEYTKSRKLPGYPGIDIKADGGYVAAPPSIHPATGRPYTWGVGLSEPTEMHPALARLVRHEEAPAPTARLALTTAPAPGCISRPDRLLAVLLDKVRDAPESKRRVTLWACAQGVARMVRAKAISHRDAVAALEDAAATASTNGSHGLAPVQIRNAIRDGFAAEGVTA